MKQRWMGTSWKMNKTLAEARHYAQALGQALVEDPALTAGVRPFIIPSHTAIAAVAETLGDLTRAPDGVLIGAQNAHWEPAGAWTGEISVPQAADAGAQMIEIGHSERREHFNETIETTRLKVAATLNHGLIPLLCIGEPTAVRRAGSSTTYILEQAAGALDSLSESELSRVLIAYEPTWAIGEQGRPARPEELVEAFDALQVRYGGRTAGILYGGSVNLENASDLLSIHTIDGLFIGRAAWDVTGYLKLLALAASTD